MNERFERAMALIDEENSRDPSHEIVNGQAIPRELLYSQRLTGWILRLEPNASEALRLAARSQHIARWRIPRSSYPEGRAGYLKWRNDLKHFHADRTSELLGRAGYDPEMIGRVRALNLKQGFPADPEAQTVEDALCLMFLEHQLSDLAAKLPRDKVVNAICKSWGKMSRKAREEALLMPFGSTEKTLLQEALLEIQGVS